MWGERRQQALAYAKHGHLQLVAGIILTSAADRRCYIDDLINFNPTKLIKSKDSIKNNIENNLKNNIKDNINTKLSATLKQPQYSGLWVVTSVISLFSFLYIENNTHY